METKGIHMGTRYFYPAVFTFLRELEANNEKQWWEANKTRYIDTIREPARDFIADFGDRLKTISPHFTADPRTNGGSLMRPYRDVRFSKDKTPYKTNVGIQFRHERGKDIHAPGFYVHLEPGQSFTGVGMWHPEAQVARTLRHAISDDPKSWAKAAHSAEFERSWSLGDHEEDRLKRVPKELDQDHPYPDDLRLKTSIAGARLTQKTVTSAGFSDDLYTMFEQTAPFAKFLCDTLEVAF